MPPYLQGWGSRYRYVSNKIDPFTRRHDFSPSLPLIFTRKSWGHVHRQIEGGQLSGIPESRYVFFVFRRSLAFSQCCNVKLKKKVSNNSTSDYDIDNPLPVASPPAHSYSTSPTIEEQWLILHSPLSTLSYLTSLVKLGNYFVIHSVLTNYVMGLL